jgi:hypothetical protein
VKELPIACALDAAEGELRLTQWRRVGEHARLTVQLAAHKLVVTYQPQVLAQLRELVQAERGCCSFLDWSLEESSDQVALTIRSDENGEPALRRLADLFGALRGS